MNNSQREEEERQIQKEKIEQQIKDSTGYTELVRINEIDDNDQQDDYVEEYMDDNTEMSALEQLQKKIQKKILEVYILIDYNSQPVDHSKINYIPIRKNFYMESPLIAKMTDVTFSLDLLYVGRSKQVT